jgi:trimeric autotransporter adhesin
VPLIIDYGTQEMMDLEVVLDADLLDGIDSSQFLRSDANDSATGVIDFTGGSGTVPAVRIRSGGSSWSEGLAVHPLADNGYALTFFRTRTSFTDSTATWAIGNLGDNSTNNFGLLRNGLTGSAAIRADCAFDVTQAGVFRFGFTPTVGANTVWHSGNDGAGSGLDADLWDGQQFSSYLNQALLTSSGPTFQNVYVNGWFRNNNASEGLYNQATDSHFYSAGANYWHINPDSGNATGGGLIFYSAYNASQGDSTNRKGYVYWDSSGFGLLSSDGSWAYRHNNTHADIYGTIRQDGTNTVWHAGNDGSGSGLDADLLDGIDSSQFLRSDADDNTTGKTTVIGGNLCTNNCV